jgi:predicted glutamine amidotransferase
MVGYFGPSISLARIIMEPSHGLLHQSRAAREMSDSSVAGDGWAAGWFSDGAAAPGIIKSAMPIWCDANAATVLPGIAARSIAAEIRLAAPGAEVSVANTPLFRFGDSLFTMNGAIVPWPGAIARELRNCLHPDDADSLIGNTDAEVLGALWHTFWRRSPGSTICALNEALSLAQRVTRMHRGTIRANLLVVDASQFVAVKFASGAQANSLYYLAGEDRWHGAAIAVSEPLDDGPGWRSVPDSALVLSDSNGARIQELQISSSDTCGPV